MNSYVQGVLGDIERPAAGLHLFHLRRPCATGFPFGVGVRFLFGKAIRVRSRRYQAEGLIPLRPKSGLTRYVFSGTWDKSSPVAGPRADLVVAGWKGVILTRS